ncbi:uncharacterized protein LOC105156397 [Sesamum indicum]|uniref:Uncharacterized protein LOC105156397 n=1 Tax=Sesamum indicum TaxID=4182 RepID=A0A6I9SMR2_SESIN|nr:uncharacterized protein LOC105156397 [Sesamum indicum]
MGKKLDALLRRGFKTSKFKATVALAVSRLAVLKNQRQARCSIAQSDVVEFLKSSNHDRALLRVEQVIKEQNMLDVFVVLEGYCHLLIERVNLFEQEKVCPEELKEAVSTLIFAATRCGEFPELQQIRAIFTSRFGKEFAARAVELRNNCGVNPKIIQKLSTKPPSLENKMKALKEIASDYNIDLPMEETVSDSRMEDQDSSLEKQQKPSQSGPSRISNQGENESMLQPADEIDRGEDFSDTLKIRRKYKDVADAAEEAFKSAAYAAAAARAAVELSRSESTDPDDPNTPNIRLRNVTATIKPIKAELQTHEEDIAEDEHMKTEVKFEKIHPVQYYDLESKDAGIHEEKGEEQFKGDENGTEFKRSLSASSLDSSDDNVKGVSLSSDEAGQSKKGGVVFDESDGEDEQEMRVPGTYDFNAGQKNDVFEGRSRAQVGVKMKTGPGNAHAQFATEKKTQIIEPLNINRRPISVRTRWAHR